MVMLNDVENINDFSFVLRKLQNHLTLGGKYVDVIMLLVNLFKSDCVDFS